MATKFVKTQHPKAKHRRLAVFEYKTTKLIVDSVLLDRIYQAWRKCKSPVGYCTYTDIHSLTRIPYAKIFGVLKWFHQEKPRAIHFNIDRYGHNVYFKFDQKVIG